MSAGFSLLAIKWVSYKIKRMFVINTIKTEDFKNIINLLLTESSNKLLLHQIVKRGSIACRIHLFFFHFSRFAVLWFPMRHESVTPKVKILSVKNTAHVLMVFHNIYFKSTFISKGLRRANLFINIHDGGYFCKLETVFRHDCSMC